MKRLVLAAILIAVTSACGSDSPTGPSPFNDTSSGTVPATTSLNSIGYATKDITAPRAGSFATVLTWSSGIVDLDLFVTNSTCTTLSGLLLGQCTVLGSSTQNAGVTTERVSLTVTNGQLVRIWVVNNSSLSQAFTVTTTIN